MFDHVTLRVSDRGASERFYSSLLATLEVGEPESTERYVEWADLSIAPAREDRPVTRRLHVGCVAPSRAHVDEFWRVGTSQGFRDDGAPGLRPQYGDDYYGAFLLDPDGNSVEAVHHGALRRGGVVDHLWIRVADVAASRRFYELVAAQAGFRLAADLPDRTRFAGETGSFSVVDGPPTEHVHLAFPAPDDARVGEFHRALTGAGYRDNGGPGERAIYHPGYYGAFVLDPDGNNVELVNHNRQ